MSGSSTALNGEYTYTGDTHGGKNNSDATATMARNDEVEIDDDRSIRSIEEERVLERKLLRKIDLRLCTIAGILCSLNLLDSGIISSASVTSIFTDLELGVGNRYVSLTMYEDRRMKLTLR